MTTNELTPLLAAVEKEEAALDREIAAWSAAYAATGKRLFCSAGCGNCCTLFVQSTLAEALAVAAALDPEQLRCLSAYIERQRASLTTATDFLTLLRRQRTEVGPCPFLDRAGSCTIYALRPLACRALLSTKPADWCGVDFSELSPLDKRLYSESLDRAVVAYPVHYVAATQGTAEAAELRLVDSMRSVFGLSVTGNFPLLVYLEHRFRLSDRLGGAETSSSVQAWLREHGYAHPLLLRIDAATAV